MLSVSQANEMLHASKYVLLLLNMADVALEVIDDCICIYTRDSRLKTKLR